MPKYMAIASYTQDGIKGLAAKGGNARLEASRKLVAEAGGSIESFYFALGSDDVFVVCDLPDNVAAAATSLWAAGSGMVVSRMVALMTADDIDQAAAMKLHLDTLW